MRYQARIYCTLGGSKPPDFRGLWPDEVVFVMSHNRADNIDLYPDDMLGHLASAVVPEVRNTSRRTHTKQVTLQDLPLNSSSSNNVLAVLDGIHDDLSDAIWAQVRIWNATSDTQWASTYFVEWIARIGNYCGSDTLAESDIGCGTMMDGIRWRRWYGSTNDYGYNASFIMPFNVTITNSFIALRDAIMIDLGNAETSSNIYLNKTYFNEVIRTDPYLTEAGNILINHPGNARINSSDYWHFCSFWSCVNTSWAEAFMNKAEDQPLGNIVLPYRPSGTQASSVLSFKYLCPTFQRKSTSAMLVSVFVTTATIIGALYTIFDLYMPKVESYYQRRKQAFAQAINRNVEDQAEEEQALVGRPLTRMNTFGSTNTLYDPVPQAEKGEEAPTKDVTINNRLQKLMD